MFDALVIGAGLAGLTTATRLAESGCDVALIARGAGGFGVCQGTLDILGYAPERVARPLDEIPPFAARNPDHPYAVIGPKAVATGAAWLIDTLGPDLLAGDPAANITLPTAVGALRPTAVAPPSMAAGDVEQGRAMAIVGFSQLKDFSPELCAANLERIPTPVGRTMTARPYRVDLPARWPSANGPADCSALAYARSIDDPGFRGQVAAAIAEVIADEEVVGLPAMLGLEDHQAWRSLAEDLGREVFEIPLIPPACPGFDGVRP